ncbi:cytochrome P450 [Hoyosella subflava]|uniref:Cytochrome P450 n=1 Tax=Hoyosella subflava (strain DSM 45089 / JCM 17490 / NBRC 109087 / DQS3-9A1) TaxID=443218 RepID=F6EPI4_HOYSD|nr:cytochrome P450 [Hoyosella subflava]AEF39417.1 Cytochrome P450 [Hoyosella subflava DQS3-9A1]
MGEPRIPEGFDFTDPDLWAKRVPIEEFAELRKSAPVWWNPQPAGLSGFDDGGYWVVSKLADVKDISKKPEIFSSTENTAIMRFNGDIERDQIDAQRVILINMDPPVHTKARRIIAKGFTPRAVSGLQDALTERAARIVHEAKKEGSGDFVQQVACELPLQAIAELLGVPQEDRRKIFDWSNEMIGYDDPEYDIDPLAASTELMGYAWNMAEDRRKCPVDDIVTKLVTADIDGESLASEEFGFFVILLAVAGNETTRNAITHGMKAFIDHPDQWEIFKEQQPRTTPDEIVRWATPVTAFQRTATEDTELGGQAIKKGQRVGLFYASANFDEEAFEEPQKFNILRDPNPHVGFGGTGTHYCIGANLARLEIDLMFKAIADAMPNIREIGPPVRLRSGWLNGIKHYPVAYE